MSRDRGIEEEVAECIDVNQQQADAAFQRQLRNQGSEELIEKLQYLVRSTDNSQDAYAQSIILK